MGALLLRTPASKLSWEPSYESTSTQPLGSTAYVDWLRRYKRVSDDELNGRFESTLSQVPSSKTIVVVTHSFELDEGSRKALLQFMNRGGSVVLSARWVDDTLAEELDIRTSSTYGDISHIDALDTSRILPDVSEFSAEGVSPYRAFESYNAYYHDDTLNINGMWEALVLTSEGTMRAGRRTYGKGELVFFANPSMFTNYALLDSTYRFYTALTAEKLPNRELVFDRYYKPNKLKDDGIINVVTKDPAISFSYTTALWASLAYVLLAMRRRQRLIPIITPPRNTSIDFAQTVAQLYDVRKSHYDVALRLADQFVWYVRRRSGVRIGVDNVNPVQIAQILGADLEEVRFLLLEVEAIYAGTWIATKQRMQVLQQRLLPIIDKDLL